MEEFRKIGIKGPILESIRIEKFEKPSEIQEKTIPLILKGKDIIAGAATGSGKTMAFASGIINNSKRGEGLQSLVLVPTRELAEQVSQALIKFSHKTLDVIPIYGGLSINPQINKLKKVEVVIGTPGRILDHIDRRTIDLSKINTLVLDEADRMFDMGFKDDVEKIISNCPRKRQTMLFSATISDDIVELTKRHMTNPEMIIAEEYVDPKKLSQVYYDVPDHLKFSLLIHLLKHEKAKLIMVFCNTRRNTDFVAKNLKFSGIEAHAIHGGFSQEKRNRTMEQFHSKNVLVLVATDVAARGLHIEGVSHVYNYDIPKEGKDYIHRIGRTARAGKEGKVINILASRDYENFSRVCQQNDLEITSLDLPKIDKVRIRWMDRPKDARRSGGRDYRRSGRSGRSASQRNDSGGRSNNGSWRNSRNNGRSRNSSGSRRDSDRGSGNRRSSGGSGNNRYRDSRKRH